MNPLLQPAPAQDPTPEPPANSTRRPRLAAATGFLAAVLAMALAGSLAAPATAGSVRTASPAASGAAPLQAAGAARVRGARLQLATFNILGSNHTRNSRRWARGTRRAGITARVIKNRGTDVIGMQEVQTDQLRVLGRQLPGFGIWPRRTLGNNGVRLQLAWRKNRFKHLRHGHINTTFAHQQRPIPWVRLQDRRSGAKLFVVNIHNSPGNQERARDRATRKEIRLVRRLRRQTGGKPVFVVGDMNEHREFFCKMGRNTPLRAAQGGNPDARPCRTPRRPRLIIDWIMGGGRVKFHSYSQQRTRLVRRASDHHYVQTTAWVGRRVG